MVSNITNCIILIMQPKVKIIMIKLSLTLRRITKIKHKVIMRPQQNATKMKRVVWFEIQPALNWTYQKDCAFESSWSRSCETWNPRTFARADAAGLPLPELGGATSPLQRPSSSEILNSSCFLNQGHSLVPSLGCRLRFPLKFLERNLKNLFLYLF